MRFTRDELQKIRDRAIADSNDCQKTGAVLTMRAMMELASSANTVDALIARAELKRKSAMPQQPKTTSAERGDITQPIEDLVGDDDLELEDEDDEDEEYEVEDDGLPG